MRNCVKQVTYSFRIPIVLVSPKSELQISPAPEKQKTGRIDQHTGLFPTILPEKQMNQPEFVFTGRFKLFNTTTRDKRGDFNRGAIRSNNKNINKKNRSRYTPDLIF